MVDTMEEGRKTLAGLILGILNELGCVPKVKLAKLVLLAEIEHFNRTGESITGLHFVRLRKGPVVAFFDQVLDENEGVLWGKETEEIPIYYEGRTGYQYTYRPLTTRDLPDTVMETVRTVTKSYGAMTGTQLSALSHSLPAWKYSEPDEPISVPELAVRSEEEYFALVDLIEDLEDDDDRGILEEVLSSPLPPVQG